MVAEFINKTPQNNVEDINDAIKKNEKFNNEYDSEDEQEELPSIEQIQKAK